LVDIEVVTNLW